MTHEYLKKILSRIDGKGYKAYKDIKGCYDYPGFTLIIDHVQGDPFAVSSRIRATVDIKRAGFPHDLFTPKVREIAFRDYIGREFHYAIRKLAKGNRGIGKSGQIEIDYGKQEVLERNSVVISEGMLEVRFLVGLPARGRTILGREAKEIFFKEIPDIVGRVLFCQNLNRALLKDHVETVEDTEFLRDQLVDKELIGFVGTGAMLPRASGVDDRPLKDAIPFRSPPELEVTLNRPNRGKIVGMGIKRGVTLIVGGGFHGKSTLLNALERGVYNHLPGDGRECTVSLLNSVKIRAEDSRRVEKVNIKPFINNLPLDRDTEQFCTDNASGSTSQAANIIEALEMGVCSLLIDEDTSATNFMIRDERMQALVTKEKEPITPFLDRIRQLYKEFGVSTVIVMGGSGDYFEVADTVIMMDSYKPVEVTRKAGDIVKRFQSKRKPENETEFGAISHRQAVKQSFDPARGKREVKIQARGIKTVEFGKQEIDISYLEQLVDPAQARAIGLAIHYYSSRMLDSTSSLKEGLDTLMERLQIEGLDILTPFISGDIAMPRIFELAGAINRMRTLRICPIKK